MFESQPSLSTSRGIRPAPNLTDWRPTRFGGLLLAVHSGACVLLLGLLLASPEVLMKVLSSLGLKSYDRLLEIRYKFILDIMLVWLLGCTLILLDALARNLRGASLLRTLFVARSGRSPAPPQALLSAAFIASFVLAPVLVVINFGQNLLGTKWLVAEDGPLETATAAAFIAAALALGYAGHRIRRGQTHSWQGLILWAVACGFFLIAMEEISWGQRLLGFATPDALIVANTQNEFNLHNIFNGQVSSRPIAPREGAGAF